VSIRWWQSPRIAASLGLTAEQREIIDRTYAERMVRQRQLVERRVEASNRADDLVRDGIYDEDVLVQTQAAADAATEERALSLVLNDEIAALLSPKQRQKLAVIVPGQLVD
jgi:Spy/CpxP family protein refolding chaperone